MPEHTSKIEAEVVRLSDKEFELLAIKLDELGFTDKIEDTYKAGQKIFGHAVDFMKKIGVLNEFKDSLDLAEKTFFIMFFSNRPKAYGGNPFD